MRLALHSIYKTYGEGDSAVHALQEVSVVFDPGIVYAVTGKSGSGKSTLLKIAGGMECPTQGKVLLDDRDIFAGTDDEISSLRGKTFGFVFQSFFLIPEYSVFDNIAMPRYVNGLPCRKEEVLSLAERLSLADKLDAHPGQLSGGQQQRVAIARACMNDPDIILADEPTGNLDEENRRDVYSILTDFAHEEGKTVIVVTHDMDFAKVADVNIKLRDGRVI